MEDVRKLSRTPFELYLIPPNSGQLITGCHDDTQGLWSYLLAGVEISAHFGQMCLSP